MYVRVCACLFVLLFACVLCVVAVEGVGLYAGVGCRCCRCCCWWSPLLLPLFGGVVVVTVLGVGVVAVVGVDGAATFLGVAAVVRGALVVVDGGVVLVVGAGVDVCCCYHLL